jgi:hypothetical protein
MITALDDALTRTVGRLPMTGAFLLAAAVYALIGLAFPLITDANVLLLVCCNVIGVLFGWALTLAWLFPWVESRVRRHLLEWTTDLRRVRGTCNSSACRAPRPRTVPRSAGLAAKR